MIKITLDASCLNPDYLELRELELLKNKGKIELFAEIPTETEKLRWNNDVKRKKIIRWMNLHTKQFITARAVPLGKSIFDMLPWSENEELHVFKKVISIHSPEFKDFKNLGLLNSKKFMNLRNDCKILTRHILLKRDYFVTMDKKGFISGGRKEKFEKTFGIKIRLLNKDFINELKKIVDK